MHSPSLDLDSAGFPFTPARTQPCGSRVFRDLRGNENRAEYCHPQGPHLWTGNSRHSRGISLMRGALRVARPYWSGQIRISLVSFGVKLFPATEAKSEIHFHQIDRKTGERVRHQKVAEGDEEPVGKEDIVKGYEYSKGHYIQ